MTRPVTLEGVLDDIPEEYRDRYEALLGEAPVSAAEMRAEIERYLKTVRVVAPMVGFLDLDDAERLSETTLALVGLLRPDLDPLIHRLVQAAVHYFVHEEDDEEITGVLGFDDDIQVVNAVSRALGRHDLVLALKQRE